MGLLVWAEVPVISHFVDAKFENAKQKLTELITQNKNHPCIYCWGVQNEITMSGKPNRWSRASARLTIWRTGSTQPGPPPLRR